MSISRPSNSIQDTQQWMGANVLPEPKANEPECIVLHPTVGDENQGDKSLIKAPANLNFMLNRRSRSVRMSTTGLRPQQM
jgi:hypothetical protein